MAPRRKRQKLNVVCESSAGQQEILNDIKTVGQAFVGLPDEAAVLKEDLLRLRRQTYVIHKEDDHDLNWRVTYNAQDGDSHDNAEKDRRLTYVIDPKEGITVQSEGLASNPGIEMSVSEQEINGIEIQTPENVAQGDNLPKRHRKKKTATRKTLKKVSENIENNVNVKESKVSCEDKPVDQHLNEKNENDIQKPEVGLPDSNKVSSTEEQASTKRRKATRKRGPKKEAYEENAMETPTPELCNKPSKRGRKKKT
ncbi:uncharacterized protein LOC108708239 [Xenopus laevis]|uniref:Uncharacterized protein LOC108708239 n=2 Tax=Xenopus laevis TaxID=8355 RepID=A0A1L8HFH1_XENLA|nr:uncharacterized protein LOC108708239 [Xenopus laevis]OCT94840.1 hypothetical protein XELAEV_18012521mg [Xenopus laevis]